MVTSFSSWYLSKTSQKTADLVEAQAWILHYELQWKLQIRGASIFLETGKIRDLQDFQAYLAALSDDRCDSDLFLYLFSQNSDRNNGLSKVP